MEDRAPTEYDARAIAEGLLERAVRQVRRFSLGGSHYVYGVTDEANRRIVVRIIVDPGKFAGALYWYNRLCQIGVPLPALLRAETDAATFGFPYLILEWLPGRDLGQVYPALSASEKRTIAHAIAAIQARVGTLPHAHGYGFARSYDDPTLHPHWRDVLMRDLARSRKRIEAAGIMDVRYVDQVEAKLPAYAAHCAAVAPVAFLDDTSTMNVLVDRGRLSGIIDVDFVCFGDPLFTPALTRMALLSRGFATDYIDYWCEMLDMNDERRRALNLYTAIFCVNFIGEIGQRFNRAVAPPVDPAYVARLNMLLPRLLEEC